MLSDDAIHTMALDLFLQANPQVAKEYSEYSEENSCGMTEAEYRFTCLARALEKVARGHRMSAWEYQLKLVEESGGDVSAARARAARAEADALGLDSLL
ncbi:hypothetical protein D3C77_658480 [compost metagenome]